jgi:hypothetical protein
MGILWSIGLCDNCLQDIKQGNKHHRCKADPDSCVEGIDCPDYVKECTCKSCWPEEK